MGRTGHLWTSWDAEAQQMENRSSYYGSNAQEEIIRLQAIVIKQRDEIEVLKEKLREELDKSYNTVRAATGEALGALLQASTPKGEDDVD